MKWERETRRDKPFLRDVSETAASEREWRRCDETVLCDDEECFSCNLLRFMGYRDEEEVG